MISAATHPIGFLDGGSVIVDRGFPHLSFDNRRFVMSVPAFLAFAAEVGRAAQRLDTGCDVIQLSSAAARAKRTKRGRRA